MINELYGLSKTLSNTNIKTYEWHREYKEIPKVKKQSPCIRVWLDDDGLVYDFEGLSSEQASVIRKFGNNQGTFPAFNINALYRLTDTESIEKVIKIEKGDNKPEIDEISSYCTENNWSKKAAKNVQRNLTDCPTKLLNLVGEAATGSVISKLAAICLCTAKNEICFRDSLEKCIMEKLKKEEDTLLCLTLLFHKDSAEKAHSNDSKNKISIVLDVHNWRECGYPVACEHTTRYINDLLVGGKTATTQEDLPCKQTDAFNTAFENPGKPMPRVKLSSFEVSLRSMYEAQPCQLRYRKSNDKSYPISYENRSLVKNALEWVCSTSNEHITWEKLDNDEIVFIYPSSLPEAPLKYVSVFCKKRSVNEKMRFEKISGEFATVFRGIPTKQKPENMQVFIIRKVGRERTKVIFSHNLTPHQLITAADDWLLGCSNLPKLRIGEIDTPFPTAVAGILNSVWKRNGEKVDKEARVNKQKQSAESADKETPVKRMKYYQGIELLLNVLPQSALHNFLHVQLENGSGLICHLGNQLHCGINDRSKRAEETRYTAGQILSVIGLLLYKFGMRKENYMENFAYLLGQLLNVSDELHLLYCKVQRNGDIPPQLVGNALFSTAADMPFRTISVLSTRITPYVSLAKSHAYAHEEKEGEESWRAIWLLGVYQLLSDKLITQMDKSTRFGDFEKAQLFIGYMATLPKSKKSDKSSSENKNDITGGTNNVQ